MACCNPNIVAETISQGDASTGGNMQRIGENSGTVAQNVGGNAQVGGANTQFGGKSNTLTINSFLDLCICAEPLYIKIVFV